MMVKKIAIAVLGLFTALAYSEVYRCELGGGVVYQDMPCPRQYEKTDLPKAKIKVPMASQQKKISKMNGATKECTLTVLQEGYRSWLAGTSRGLFCGKPANVSKDVIFKKIPGAIEINRTVSDFVILEWVKKNKKYRLSINKKDNLVHRAAVYID